MEVVDLVEMKMVMVMDCGVTPLVTHPTVNSDSDGDGGQDSLYHWTDFHHHMQTHPTKNA